MLRLWRNRSRCWHGKSFLDSLLHLSLDHSRLASCLAAYIKRQLSIKTPVLDPACIHLSGLSCGRNVPHAQFRHYTCRYVCAAAVLPNAMLIAVAAAGVLMLPGGLINAAVSVAAGTLFDRFGARGPVSIGFACSALASAMLMVATPQTPIWYMVACHIIMMIGVPLAMSPCQTHALASLPPQLNSDGSTFMNTLQQVLGAICTAVATCLLLAAGQTPTLPLAAPTQHLPSPQDRISVLSSPWLWPF